MKRLIHALGTIALGFLLVTPSFAGPLVWQSIQPGSAAQTATRSHAATKGTKATHHFKKHRKHAHRASRPRTQMKRGAGRAIPARYRG